MRTQEKSALFAPGVIKSGRSGWETLGCRKYPRWGWSEVENLRKLHGLQKDGSLGIPPRFLQPERANALAPLNCAFLITPLCHGGLTASSER